MARCFGKGGLSGVEFALCLEDVPDAAVGDGQLALPAGIAGIGGGEAAADGEVFGKGGLGGVEFALASRTPPTRLWATASSRCQPALLGSAAARRRLMARYSAKAAWAASSFPCASRNAADTAMSDGQIALPAGIAGIGCGEAAT